MKKCKHIDSNGRLCQEPVLSRPIKNVPSVRVPMGSKGEFIWMFPSREPASDYCYYHDSMRRSKFHKPPKNKRQ